jgi:hypothetical protein
MKTLNNYIIEKLVIKKNLNTYNPDDLNGDNQILYSSDDDEYGDETAWDCLLEDLKYIDNHYAMFLVTKFVSLGEALENFEEDDFCDYSFDLEQIRERIITGKDYGYEVRLVGGHLEFDCINSGSRATYYVYAISSDKKSYIYDLIDEWFSGTCDDDELLNELKTPGVVEEITFK